jgi:PilZ domain
MEERRKFLRKPLVVPLEVFSKDLQKSIAKGFVIDLNEAGMRILADDDLNIGEEFRMNFHMHNNHQLDFFGTIIHKAEGFLSNAYGVKFLDGQDTALFRSV